MIAPVSWSRPTSSSLASGQERTLRSVLGLAFAECRRSAPRVVHHLRNRGQSLHRQQPNKRLKLTGGDRFKGNGVLCPWRGTDCRPLLLRRRASRPQLKRDPLGGALPPHKHSFVKSFGTVSTRGAERRCSRGGICSPRPTHHGRATGCRAAHVLPLGGCPQRTCQPKGGRRLRAARGAREPRGQARRLTCAWSWRRPSVEVEFHL